MAAAVVSKRVSCSTIWLRSTRMFRWTFREIEKIGLSSHAHSIAVKTYFLPILMRMRGIKGNKKLRWQKMLTSSNKMLSPIGNLLIAFIFKRPPSTEQEYYLISNGYKYKKLVGNYPSFIKLPK